MNLLLICTFFRIILYFLCVFITYFISNSVPYSLHSVQKSFFSLIFLFVLPIPDFPCHFSLIYVKIDVQPMRQNGGFFMSTGNQEYIRDMNRALVLEAIANHPPLSRADLAKMLHLTKATVSTIVQELLDRQLVIELGSAEKTSMGRKPILLTFNNRCGSIIAVDLGVKKITILTGDLKGKSCTVKEYPIDPSLSLEEYLISLLHKTKSDLPKTPCGLVGISIGIYGVVCDDLVLFTPYYDLKHSNLKNYLEEEFQVPVIVENEANLSVIGEAACAEHFKNMIFLNIHEGVGMGILIDGELYTGQNGYAGEFGHTILFPDGRPCPCGNHGCLEQYISEAAVLNDFAAAEGLENVSVERFIQYYQEGNPNARKVMQDFTHYIGISLNTVLHTFNYHSASHCKYLIQYHIIWCPKFRFSVLHGKADMTLKQILQKICEDYGYRIKALEVMPDHIHIFVDVPQTVAPCDVVRTLKSKSAIELFKAYPTLKRFYARCGVLWSRGYFISTVGQISEATVMQYIEEQKSHE